MGGLKLENRGMAFFSCNESQKGYGTESCQNLTCEPDESIVVDRCLLSHARCV